jgi:outer membrane protein assembly factor BamB
MEVYNISTGQLVWEIYVGRGGLSVSFDDITDIVYLTTTFFISANDISNGDQVWKIEENTITGTYDMGVLYYSTQLSKKNYTVQVSAIDAQSLKLFWDAEIAQGLGNSLFNLTVFDDMLLASTNFGLLALDKKDGNTLWKSETSEFFYGKPVVINDVIYLRGTTSSVIYAIFPADGRYLGTLSLEKSSILSTSQREYDIVYKADEFLVFPFENTIYAYH